jgi:hypothetical protein
VDALFALSPKVAYPLLRIAMGIVLLWIGVVHLIDPSPVVALLGMSLPFLAFSGFVYLLGAYEIVLAVALFAGIGVRYVGLALVLVLGAKPKSRRGARVPGQLVRWLETPTASGQPVVTAPPSRGQS